MGSTIPTENPDQENLLPVSKDIKMSENQLEKTNYIKLSNIDKAQKFSKGEHTKVAVLGWLFDMSPKAKKLYYAPTSFVPNEKYGTQKPWHGSWMVDLILEVAPKTKIIPIRVVPNGNIRDKNKQKYVIEGIKYAADHGAVAVTNSTGPITDSSAFRDAVRYAEENGCIFVDVHPEAIGWTAEGHGKFPKNKNELVKQVIHTGVLPSKEFPKVFYKNLRDIFTYGYEITSHFKSGFGYSNAPQL